jgi:hypothetical protein
MSTQAQRGDIARSLEIERRSSPRIEVLERVQSRIRALDAPITLLNLSRSGFSMQVDIRYRVGEIHEFSFTSAESEAVLLRARVVREMRATSRDVSSFIVGLEFLRDTEAADDGIEGVMRLLEQ